MPRALAREPEARGVELGRRESRGAADRGEARAEQTAERVRGIAAEALERRLATDEAGQADEAGLAALRHEAVELEGELEERRQRAGGSAGEHPGRAQRECSERRGELGERGLGRLALDPVAARAGAGIEGGLGEARLEGLAELAQLAMHCAAPERARLDGRAHGGPAERHRERLAGALGQLVRLVDHEDRLAQPRGIAQLGQSDHRIDRIVEIAHRHRRFARGVELELVGTGRGVGAEREDGVGQGEAPRIEAARHEVSCVALLGVAAGARADRLVAEQVAARAHARLRAQPRHEAQPPRRETSQRIDDQVLLERAGGQHHEAPPGREREAQRGREDGGGLPAAGCGFEQQQLALRERALHVRHDLGLARPQRGVGKADRRGGVAPGRAGGVVTLEPGEQRIERALQPALDGLGRQRDRLAQRGVGAEEDELGLHRAAADPLEHARVQRRLELPERGGGGGSRRRPLELFDPPARPVGANAIGAAAQRHLPAAMRERLAERHLRLEGGVAAGGVPLVFRVQRLPEPRAVSAAAASEARAAVGPEQQLGDSDPERALGRVGARGSAAIDESKTKEECQRKAGPGRLVRREMTAGI